MPSWGRVVARWPVDALRVMRRAGFEGDVHLVETSPALREAQARLLPEANFHDGIADLPDVPLLLVANEFFDALPVQQFVDGRERHVVLAAGGFAFDRDGPIVEQSPAREPRSPNNWRGIWPHMAAPRSSSITAIRAASRATRCRRFAATAFPMFSTTPASRI